jgi:predicted RNase H-like HicB family nuclease
MKTIKYIIYREGRHYVSQCLNVDISSFGNTVEEAKNNLQEALELHFEDATTQKNFIQINETMVGEMRV